jgi:hypothetical protein
VTLPASSEAKDVNKQVSNEVTMKKVKSTMIVILTTAFSIALDRSCVSAVQSGKTVSAGRGKPNRAHPSSMAATTLSATPSIGDECPPRIAIPMRLSSISCRLRTSDICSSIRSTPSSG